MHSLQTFNGSRVWNREISNASLMITASSSMLVASVISAMLDQGLARLARTLPLAEILLHLFAG